jgi:peptide/nickel transport system substrate-binding protein
MRLMEAMQRGITRRQMIQMLIAGGMQAALAGSLAGIAGSAYAQTPRKGGRIRVAGATAAVSDTLDPSKGSNHTDYIRACMFYNCLTWLDGSLTPQPALAEEFVTKDGITWIFKLRKGVQFHDGKPLAPADVVFSIMRHKNPATGSKAKALADQIEEVKATGPNEVTIRLQSANADLPVILGTFHFHIVKDGTTDFNAGIGTGPYKVKEFKPGIRSIAVRNDAYWRSGRPYLDEIEYVGIGDEGARINALLSGELEMVGTVNPRSVQRVRDSAGHAIFETRAGTYTDLVMRREGGPGSNPDFVLAMKYLFDREQMKRSIALDHAVSPTISRSTRPTASISPDCRSGRSTSTRRSSTCKRPTRQRAGAGGRVTGGDLLRGNGLGAAADRAKAGAEPRPEAHAGRRLLVQPLDESPWVSAASIPGRAPIRCSRSSSSPTRHGTRRGGRTRSSTSC